jgi:Holliday junction resolvasome RuvABC DNA-binding subunit
VQVTISVDTIRYVELISQGIGIVVTLIAVGKKIASTIETKMNDVITSNANRNRDETLMAVNKYLDRKFENHEINAFEKLDNQSKQLDEMLKVLNQINSKLSKGF